MTPGAGIGKPEPRRERPDRPEGGKIGAARGGSSDIVLAKAHLSRCSRWTTRSRRPPLDRINALLSFLYTLLTHDCRSAAEAVGLDPAVGFLHRDRPGRPSLALDLMEELRAVLADRLALSLVNRRQIREDDFETRDGGAVILTDVGRKTVLDAWQERKHPFLGEKIPMGLVPYVQAQMLARHLRGDLDAYPPWLWK